MANKINKQEFINFLNSNNNLTYREVAKNFNTSTATVRNANFYYNVNYKFTRKKRLFAYKIKQEEFLSFLNSHKIKDSENFNLTRKQIAEHFGVCKRTVIRLLDKLKISRSLIILKTNKQNYEK